jgi:hypothetical protein
MQEASMHRTRSLAVGYALAFAFISASMGGCVWNAERGDNGGGGGTGNGLGGHASGRGGNAGTGVVVDAPITPSDDANCGQRDQPTTMQPPDLLLVLDRSLSMNMDPMGNNCPANMPGCSKWDQMTAAINMAVGMTDTMDNWGLKFFGDGTTNNTFCQVNPGVAVNVGAMNAANIATAIAGTMPSTATPTTAALVAAGTYLRGLTDTNPKYIVLATDGAPTCRNGGIMTRDDAAAIAQVLTEANMGTQTFVIGIATSNDPMATATLNQMAVNGGHPQMGAATSYYAVSNTADLVTALSTISTIAASCTLSLGGVPPNPDNIVIEGDGTPIPEDPTNGWQYGPGQTSVVLNGTYCDSVKNQSIKVVKAIFGCGTVPIVP